MIEREISSYPNHDVSEMICHPLLSLFPANLDDNFVNSPDHGVRRFILHSMATAFDNHLPPSRG
jgi:hypothetical protein